MSSPACPHRPVHTDTAASPTPPPTNAVLAQKPDPQKLPSHTSPADLRGHHGARGRDRRDACDAARRVRCGAGAHGRGAAGRGRPYGAPPSRGGGRERPQGGGGVRGVGGGARGGERGAGAGAGGRK
eukprot:157816-Chlamydomonas_euryale.AAC.3